MHRILLTVLCKTEVLGTITFGTYKMPGLESIDTHSIAHTHVHTWSERAWSSSNNCLCFFQVSPTEKWKWRPHKFSQYPAYFTTPNGHQTVVTDKKNINPMELKH